MPEPIPIESPDDPRIAPYRAMRERDLIGRGGRFIVEGDVTLRVMLSPRSRFALESILLAPERVDSLRALIAALPDPPPLYVASKAVMSAITGFPIHRGVLAVGLRTGEPGLVLPPAPAPALVVGLVGLTNHDNVGGLFRNAAAFGAAGLLLDGQTCDPLYRKAIRVSAGAALTVPFERVPDAASMLALAARHDLVPIALSPTGHEVLSELGFLSRVLLLLGTEGPGLPGDLMRRLRTLRIPMVPDFDSLNVATAGAIALHHLAGRSRATIGGNCRALPNGQD